MAGETVVTTKEGMTLVSWTYRDIVHYGIKDVDDNFLEVFKPTSGLKGQALRSYVLSTFRAKELGEYMGTWPSLTMNPKKVQEGNVLAYESKPGEVVFAKVTSITPSIIFALKNNGKGDTLWLTEKLLSKLQERSVIVISQESVPEKYRVWEE